MSANLTSSEIIHLQSEIISQLELDNLILRQEVGAICQAVRTYQKTNHFDGEEEIFSCLASLLGLNRTDN